MTDYHGNASDKHIHKHCHGHRHKHTHTHTRRQTHIHTHTELHAYIHINKQTCTMAKKNDQVHRQVLGIPELTKSQ